MKLIVKPSPMQDIWSGYKRWAGYSLVASDGRPMANGHIRLSALHELTALLFKSADAAGEGSTEEKP